MNQRGAVKAVSIASVFGMVIALLALPSFARFVGATDHGAECAAAGAISIDAPLLNPNVDPSRPDVTINLPQPIVAGTYSVTLVSFDDHSINRPEQTEEQWFAQLLDADGQVVYTSDPIRDLPDNQDFITDIFDQQTVTGTATQMRAVHRGAGDSVNSIVALCALFTLEKPSRIIVQKVTEPAGSTHDFIFTPSYGPDFTLQDGQQHDSGPLDPGTHTVSETVPDEWKLTSATCDDGSAPDAIDLQEDEIVTCTFTNAEKKPDSTTTVTLATINQAPVAVAGGPYAGTVDEAVAFSSVGSTDSDGDIESYLWEFGDGDLSDRPNREHSYDKAGVYEVTLTVTDNDGDTDTATTTASINQPPVAEASGPYAGTVDEAVAFSSVGSTDSDGDIESYVWEVGDGDHSHLPNPEHSYDKAGVYEVILTVTDDDGDTDTATTTASISPDCRPDLSTVDDFRVSPQSGKPGSSVELEIAFAEEWLSACGAVLIEFTLDGHGVTEPLLVSGPFSTKGTIPDDAEPGQRELRVQTRGESPTVLSRVPFEVEKASSTQGLLFVVALVAGALIVSSWFLLWRRRVPGAKPPVEGPSAIGAAVHRPRVRIPLQPNGDPISVGPVRISSPGLSGEVSVHRPADSDTGSITRWTEAVDEAFRIHHLETELVIEMTETAELPDQAPVDVPTFLGEPAIVLEVPDPGEAWGQVVLATDEGGITTWNYPRTRTGDVDTARDNNTRTYYIPRRVAAKEEPPKPRSLFGSFGSKVLSVIVFPVLDPVFGRVGEWFAREWEEHKRPYRFRTFTGLDYDQAGAAEPDWAHLASGKSLLLVHGTFSQAHTGFGSFSRHFVDELHEIYDGRVLAFDHPTLSDDPKQNTAWFVEHLPEGMELDVDIICHSRGGLVSRVLAEKQAELPMGNRRVDIEKIIFVASPNAGTILADPAYLGDLVDSYTNILNFTPSNLVTEVLQDVITVAKHITVGTLERLEGLQAMRPDGPFLRWLNSPATNPSHYFAVAGNYEPAARAWRQYVADRLMDRIFQGANDLVVPTVGTYGANGSSHFPIATRLDFSEFDEVHHTEYFGNKRTREYMLEWLST